MVTGTLSTKTLVSEKYLDKDQQNTMMYCRNSGSPPPTSPSKSEEKAPGLVTPGRGEAPGTYGYFE